MAEEKTFFLMRLLSSTCAWKSICVKGDHRTCFCVGPQCTCAEIASMAFITHERLLSQMHSLVVISLGICRKGLGTKIAFKRFNFCMCQTMFIQVTWCGKLLWALFTLKWLLSCVTTKMCCQNPWMRKTLLAFTAFVGFFSSMSAKMNIQTF